LVLALALGGCSSGWFGSSNDSSNAEARQQEGGEDRPNLSSVPGERPEASSQEQREVIYQGLYNDRENARHFEGPVAREGTQTASAETADLSRARIVNPRNRQEVEFNERRAAAIRELCRRLELTCAGNRIARVQFAPGQTTLPAGSGGTIINAGRFARATESRLLIVGHTAINSGESDDVLNQRSQQRAQAIANGLVRLGFPTNQIRVVGRGRQQPVTRNPENDAQNSRVDIYFQQ
jgi:outer membrane protein OmpA-like peptidoglycan-associated protein